VTGFITDPRKVFDPPQIALPDRMRIDDSAVYPPAPEDEADRVEIVRGKNIAPLPQGRPPEDSMRLTVSLKVGDNITTDHIMPAGAKILPFRSNIPLLSRYCFTVCDPEFPERARALGRSAVVGGENYGQGSSREHAALVPLYLGVTAVIAVSFARIHRANLINAGIIPFTFRRPADAGLVAEGDVLSLEGVRAAIGTGVMTAVTSDGREIVLDCPLTDRQKKILLAGGLLALTAEENEGERT
jgi:aconitate hydratase